MQSGVATRAVRWLEESVFSNGTLKFFNVDNSTSSRHDVLGMLSYAAEGVIAVDRALPSLHPSLARTFEPTIQYLLRTQLRNGSWPTVTFAEKIRATRAVSFLSWHYATVGPDAAVAEALKRFSGMLIATPNRYLVKHDMILTGFSGLVACDILEFGSTFA